MLIQETEINGAYLIELEKQVDERGFFARTWCADEFANVGLPYRMVQSSVSFNNKKGTLRGLHYQVPPSKECKLVRVTSGSIFDVIVDLRPHSPSYLHHLGITLKADNYKALFIPPSIAHGFQTLEDDSEVFYQMTDFYDPKLACGVRWNDPVFDIEWPDDKRIIIERDDDYPDFVPHVISELE